MTAARVIEGGEIVEFLEDAVAYGRREKWRSYRVEGGRVVATFEGTQDAYRTARDGQIIDSDEIILRVDWQRDLREANGELGDAAGLADVAAVLAIPGAAETIAAMHRLHDEIKERLGS